jgi:hypothetical protein
MSFILRRRPLATGELSQRLRHLWLLRWRVLAFIGGLVSINLVERQAVTGRT